MSLKMKLNLASASLILIMVIGMMGLLYISEKKQLRERIEIEQVEDLGKLDRVHSEFRITDEETIFLNYVQTLIKSPKVAYAGYVTRDGHGWTYWADGNALELNDAKSPTIQGILDTHRFLRRQIVTSDGRIVIELTQPARAGDFVRIGYSKTEVDRTLKNNIDSKRKGLTIFGLVAIFIGLLLSQIFSAALARPINSLMKAALDIAHGKKGVQIAEQGKDELGQLTRTFNQMSQELTKLDELKDEFMSHVTHELRSPLTSIIATVELLAEMPLAGKDAKFKRSIDRLIYGSERLNRLVDNILDLTRMEAGKMPFDIQPANLAPTIKEMADFFEPRAMEKNLKIMAKVSSNLPPVLCDVEKVRQVLSNLIYNAIKFTNEGSIVVSAKEKDGLIQVAVEDTGVGIPADKIGGLFQKFGTLRDTKDRVAKPVPGTGLGLVIVKNSIEAQGGKIWVESEMNKGTSFIFTLPLAPVDARVKPSESEMEPKIEQPRHVVVVDEKKSAVL